MAKADRLVVIAWNAVSLPQGLPSISKIGRAYQPAGKQSRPPMTVTTITGYNFQLILANE